MELYNRFLQRQTVFQVMVGFQWIQVPIKEPAFAQHCSVWQRLNSISNPRVTERFSLEGASGGHLTQTHVKVVLSSSSTKWLRVLVILVI